METFYLLFGEFILLIDSKFLFRVVLCWGQFILWPFSLRCFSCIEGWHRGLIIFLGVFYWEPLSIDPCAVNCKFVMLLKRWYGTGEIFSMKHVVFNAIWDLGEWQRLRGKALHLKNWFKILCFAHTKTWCAFVDFLSYALSSLWLFRARHTPTRSNVSY